MSGYTRREQMLSALLLIAALEQTFQNCRFVPEAEVASPRESNAT